MKYTPLYTTAKHLSTQKGVLPEHIRKPVACATGRLLFRTEQCTPIRDFATHREQAALVHSIRR